MVYQARRPAGRNLISPLDLDNTKKLHMLKSARNHSDRLIFSYQHFQLFNHTTLPCRCHGFTKNNTTSSHKDCRVDTCTFREKLQLGSTWFIYRVQFRIFTKTFFHNFLKTERFQSVFQLDFRSISERTGTEHSVQNCNNVVTFIW